MTASNTVEIADILSSAICRIKHLLFRIKKLRIVWLKAAAICWMGWQFQTWARPLTVNELDNILLQSQGFKNYLFWQSWSIIYGLYWFLVVNTVTAAHVVLDHEPIRARIEYKLSGFELTGWWFKPPTPSFSDHSIVTPQPLISCCVADSPVNFSQFEPCKLCRLAHWMERPDDVHPGASSASHNDSRSHLWSASNGDLVVPSTRLNTGERAFSVAAPQAWHRLQAEQKTMVDTARF